MLNPCLCVRNPILICPMVGIYLVATYGDDSFLTLTLSLSILLRKLSALTYYPGQVEALLYNFNILIIMLHFLATLTVHPIQSSSSQNFRQEMFPNKITRFRKQSQKIHVFQWQQMLSSWWKWQWYSLINSWHLYLRQLYISK